MIKLIIAGVAGFIISMGAGMVFHGMVLHNDYAALGPIMRPDAEAMGYVQFMFLSHLIKGFAFAWVYKQGVKDGPWLPQAIRFGVAMTLLITIPLYLVYYAVEPMPGMLVVKQIFVDAISTMLMALAVGLIIRPARA